MVHTILINNDNTITKRMNGAIMEGSSNVDSLRILVSPTYKDKFGDLVMADCICVMEITTPIGRRYKTQPLTPSEELYKERLEYLLPITLDMTKEAGKLGFKFFFTKLEMNADGTFKERIRETYDSYLDIIETKHWDDYVSTSDLRPLVDVMMTIQSKANHLEAMAEKINSTKIDNLEYDKESNILKGYADGVQVDEVQLEDTSECGCEEGVPVVEITENTEDSEITDDDSNVIEI